MIKHKIIPLLLTVCLSSILLAACSPPAKAPAMQEKEEYIFGTLVSLKLYEPVEDTVFQTIFDDLRDVDNRMTVKGITSELISVNQAAGIKPVVVSEDTYHVLEVGQEYAQASQGAFDLTIYPVVALWGIGSDQARVPSQSELDSALKNVGYEDLVLDPVNHSAFLKRTGMGLDPGAIAKGYAADRTAEKLKALGIHQGIINLGGNILALGVKSQDTPWKIGVQNPTTNRGEYIGIVEAMDQTVVTSGIYERYFEQNGKRYHHILNTQTGYPADNELAGVSILTDSSIDADALSTTCFVLGTEKALAFVKDRPSVEVLFIGKDKTIRMTPGFKKVFTLTDKSFTVVE